MLRIRHPEMSTPSKANRTRGNCTMLCEEPHEQSCNCPHLLLYVPREHNISCS